LFLFSVNGYSRANLLLVPEADDFKGKFWRTSGEATVEDFGGTKRFVIRNGGRFSQDVRLPEKSGGKYVLLIGVGNSERIFSDKAAP